MLFMRSVRCLAAVSLASVLTAQELARDVNQAPVPGPLAFMGLQFGSSNGTHAFFDGWSQDSGVELWTTDGTSAGTRLLRDLVPGSADSGPEPIQWVGNRLLFSTRTGTTRDRLWVTDGTPAGTAPVTARVSAPGALRSIGVLQGRAIFGSTTLWSSDLTDAGTSLLANVRVQGSYVMGAPVGNRLVFPGDTSNINVEPWVTDGTAAGTMPLADIYPSFSSMPDHFTAMGNFVYFLATNAAGNAELWLTDGTPAGTQRVLTTPYVRNSQQPGVLVRAGNALLAVLGGNLWRSDGTAAGTAILVPAGSGTATFGGLVSDGTIAYSLRGSVLYHSDGTISGTTSVLDLAGVLNAPYGIHYQSAVVQGQARLVHVDSNRNTTVIFSDGTAAGTTTATVANALPYVVKPAGNRLVLLARASQSSAQPFIVGSDGTQAGTSTIWTAIGHGGNPRSPGVALDGIYYTFFDDGVHGIELWRTDGTAAGTRMVIDLNPGSEYGLSPNSEIVAMDGFVYFTGTSPATGYALWRSDGTAAGTHVVYDVLGPLSGGPNQLRVEGHLLYFADLDANAAAGTVLRTDGTAAGTVAVPNTQNTFQPIYGVLDGVVVCIAPLNQVRRTDGTAAGTYALPGPIPFSMARVGDRLVYFTGQASSPLWSTDGTVAGTQQVLAAPAGGSLAGALRPWGDRLARIVGTELQITDGTIAGSSLVNLPLPGPALSYAFAGTRVYVVAEDAAHGRELWSSDGTVAGTMRVTDLAPGFQHGVKEVFATRLGASVLLSASNGIDGLEPYVSDGTAAGTVRLADLNPTGSSNPQFLGVAADRVFFLADDGSTGAEPWSLRLSDLGAPAVESLGVGCPGATGLLDLSASAPRLGSTLEHSLQRTSAFAPCLFALSIGTGRTVLPSGCVLHLGTGAVTWFALADGLGVASTSFALPNDAGLIGVVLTAQALVADPFGAALSGAATSQALLEVLGL